MCRAAVEIYERGKEKMTVFRGPIHIGLDLASDILEYCGEEQAKEIVDAIANALPGWMSV